jgi:hypothetical protein
MKYKILLSSIAIAICFSTNSYGGCVGPVVNGKCLSGTNVHGYESNDDSNNDSGYQSNSGTRYQYDINDPGDSIRYSTDLDAQRRDQMNLDTKRNLDKSSGQHGGGIYND